MSDDLRADLASLRLERAPEPRRRRRLIAAALGLAAAALAGAALFRLAGSARAAEVEVATAVERTTGGPAAVLDASGYVTARRRATVSSKITGKVIEVRVEEGMAVRRGQILARLDDTAARTALALAEAQLAAARAAVAENEVRLREALLTLERRAALAREGIAGRAEVDAAEAEVDSLRARIALARSQVEVAERQVTARRADLEDTIIRAPFDGVAISKDAQPGETISPVSAGGGFTRTGICTIVDMSSLEIEVDVGESYITRVVPGQRATAVLDAYPDWPIPARVITTIPAADRQKATVLVRLAFERLDPRILPDMGVKVAFHAPGGPEPARRTTIFVPARAVRTIDGRSVVYVVRDGRAERRAVRTGRAAGEAIEVLAGLAAGEQVVVAGPATLADGAAVTIRAR